jgi:hypothetical protein
MSMARGKVSRQVIYLQQAAPPKPELGAPCNGCGVCCAVSPCPVARVFLWRFSGACPALEWHAGDQRYLCGMLARPANYVRWLPTSAQPWFARRIRRWIAAGIGCDATVTPE